MYISLKQSEVEVLILTTMLEPILEQQYYVKKLYPKSETKAEKVRYNINGKSINIARILNRFNTSVFATGFLGGLKGTYIFNELKRLKIFNDFIHIKDETEGKLFLIEDDKILSIIGEDGPRITREDLGSFYELFSKIVDNFPLVCGAGEIPSGVPEDVYYDLIKISKSRGKKFILDAKGQELINGIEASPFMVNLSIEDLQDISKLELNFENEIIKIGKGVLDTGIELVVIDLDENGTIVLDKDRGYRLEVHEMNLNNLKEDKGYLVAGYIFGIDKRYDFETTIKLGQSFRLAYGQIDDIDTIDMTDIKKVMSHIHISPIHY